MKCQLFNLIKNKSIYRHFKALVRGLVFWYHSLLFQREFAESYVADIYSRLKSLPCDRVLVTHILVSTASLLCDKVLVTHTCEHIHHFRAIGYSCLTTKWKLVNVFGHTLMVTLFLSVILSWTLVFLVLKV